MPPTPLFPLFPLFRSFRLPIDRVNIAYGTLVIVVAAGIREVVIEVDGVVIAEPGNITRRP
jgi:hypothetical protein